MSGRERALYLGGITLLCIALYWYYHQPCPGKQAAKQTDTAIVHVEQSIKSHDAVVEKIVTDAHKEVTAQNETIRKDISALSSDAVAVNLMALLDEYRSERERGD